MVLSEQEQKTPELEQNAGDRPVERTAIGAGEIVRVILLAAFLGGVLWFFYASPWGKNMAFKNADHFREWLKQWGGWAWMMFVVVGTALVAIGFPRIVLSGIAGALFGVIWGTILAQIATSLAAAPAFFYTKFIGREMVQRRMGNRLLRLDILLKEHGFKVLLLIRLCPVGNAFITGCLAGVSSIPFGTYMIASMIGFFPETFIFALMGGGFEKNFQFRLWSSIIFLILFSLFFLWYFRRSELGARILKAMRESKQKRK